jgi:hypothetical protein
MTRAETFGTDLDMEKAEEGLKKLWEENWTEPEPLPTRHVFHRRRRPKPQTSEDQTDPQSGQRFKSSEKGYSATDSNVTANKIGEPEQEVRSAGTGLETA